MPLIVFDLDGTLVDSSRDLADATNDLLLRCGRTALPAAEVVAMVGDGARVLVERALRRAGADVPVDQALAWFREAYDRRLVATTRPYDGLPAVLDQLGRRARLAVLTNKPAGPSRAILAALGLARHFVRVIGGDGPHPRKPDPQGLLSLVAEAGVTIDEAMFVGDSMIDVETARRARVGICVALYGFGQLRGDLQLAGDERRASDAPELGRVLGQWLDDRAEEAAIE